MINNNDIIHLLLYADGLLIVDTETSTSTSINSVEIILGSLLGALLFYLKRKIEKYTPNIVFWQEWDPIYNSFNIYIIDLNDTSGLLLMYLTNVPKSRGPDFNGFFNREWRTLKLHKVYNAIFFRIPGPQGNIPIHQDPLQNPNDHLQSCRLHRYRYFIWRSLHETGRLSTTYDTLGNTTDVNLTTNEMRVIYMALSY